MNRPATLKIMPTRIMYTDRLNYLCNIKVKNKNCTYLCCCCCCCCCDAHTIYQAKEHCVKNIIFVENLNVTHDNRLEQDEKENTDDGDGDDENEFSSESAAHHRWENLPYNVA